MNPALSQEFHLFCEQEHPQRHANTDQNPYCVYGTLKVPTPKMNGDKMKKDESAVMAENQEPDSEVTAHTKIDENDGGARPVSLMLRLRRMLPLSATIGER